MRNLELRFTHADSPWTVVFLALLLLALSLTVYLRAFRDVTSWRLPLLLAALRCLSVLAVLTLLLRPVLRFEVTTRFDETLAVLVDGSRSMGIPDSVGGETRLASALRVLGSEAVQRLADSYELDVRSFADAGDLKAIPWPMSLTPKNADESPDDGVSIGSSTDLAAAWSKIEQGTRRLRGIILLSDGRDHGALSSADGSDLETAVLLPKVPVYCIGVGSGKPVPPDLALGKVSAPERVLLGSRIEIRGTVNSRGLPPAVAELVIRRGDEELSRRKVEVIPGSSTLTLELTADRAGRQIYDLRIETGETEVVRENNGVPLVLDVIDRPLRILYFDGRVRWQHKFARRGLIRDRSIQVTSLIRIGPDRILRQDANDGEPIAGLPTSVEEWSVFDVLVLGNVSADDLGDDVQSSIIRWISDGGGLVYSGGAESHRWISTTPLGELLPVEPGEGVRVLSPMEVVPEPAALVHPVTRRLLDFFIASGEKPPITVAEVFRSGVRRPGAEVLLSIKPRSEQKDDGPRFTLLATRQYGAGRVVIWLTESDWRWVMEDRDGRSERLFHIIWSRMVRWAGRRGEVSGDDGSLELSRREVFTGEDVEVSVTGSDDLDRTRIIVSDPIGERRPLEGSRDGDRWTARYTPQREGVHRFEARTGDGGSAGGEGVLVVRADTRELEESTPDWNLLRYLAQSTGGEFFSLAEAGVLADKIFRDHAGAVSSVELGMRNSWWIFIFLVSCLCAEWILRRRMFKV